MPISSTVCHHSMTLTQVDSREGQKPESWMEEREPDGEAEQMEAKGDLQPTIETDKETLDVLLRRFLEGLLRPDDATASLSARVKASCGEIFPRLAVASRNSVEDLVQWMRRGGPFPALLVVSVGTLVILALTGLVVFLLFFLVAIANTIIISFLISLVAVGGVLAIFFTFLTSIYVGALSVAVFVISAITISAVIAVLIATGWVGFFCIVWLAAKKCLDLTKHSVTVTSSAISSYSVARRAQAGQ